MKVVKEYLKYSFNEPELKEKSTTLALECRELEEIEKEKKQVMSDFKSKIDGHAATISRLSNHINNGYEYRYIECNVSFNSPNVGQKEIYRTDTGELVKTEKMTEDEYQEKLDI